MEPIKTYTYDEAFEASLKYFAGDELAARVWVNNYALKDSLGNIFEQSPAQLHWRIAHAVARRKSAQMVSTTGADVTIGWLKCAGARAFFPSSERVTTTLYSCIFPIVCVRDACVSNLSSNALSTSFVEYLRIVRLVIMLFIFIYLIIYFGCKGNNNFLFWKLFGNIFYKSFPEKIFLFGKIFIPLRPQIHRTYNGTN